MAVATHRSYVYRDGPYGSDGRLEITRYGESGTYLGLVRPPDSAARWLRRWGSLLVPWGTEPSLGFAQPCGTRRPGHPPAAVVGRGHVSLLAD